MVKNIKRLKLKITSIILLVALLSLEFSPFAVKATAQQYSFYQTSLVAVGYDEYNDKNIWYSNATLGGETAYCMDYGCAAPSGTMTFRDYISDQGMAVLIHGYPNRSPQEMGVNNADEAYMATQMALWEVVNRTGESRKSGKLLRVNEFKPLKGKEDFYQRTKAAAANLVAMAEVNPYTSVPTMIIDNANVKMTDMGEDALIGPYTVNVSGTDASSIKSIRATLKNAPASARVVDVNGNPKTDLANGETVYVRMSKSEGTATFQINFHSSVDRKVGAIYEKPGERVQDFVRIDTEPNEMDQDLTIKWEKLTTIGIIELVKHDQDNQPVVGAKFRLINSSGKVLGEIATGADGKITFYSVPVGEYTLEEVEAPSGYVIKTKSKNVTVKSGETSRVDFENERITGKLVITKVDDANKPLKGVTFEIYDEEGYLYDTLVTDENGKASLDLDYGTYFFKETKAPEGYIMDETLYKFTVDAENRTFYKTITNERYKGTLVIVKTDEDKTPIENVKFKIMDENKNELITITTNAKGLAGVKNLPLGTYYYQEVEAPDNVVMDNNIYEFKIETQNQVVRKDIVNEKIKGSLKITKVDDEDKPIQNVKFNILDASKNVVDTITTDANGVAVSKELTPGTYYYKEIEVPKEYILDSQEYKFEVKNDAKLTSVKVVNHFAEGSLQITKLDDKGTTLEGVEFDILDESKNVVDHLITDGEGKATSKKLRLGTYYYKETKAPENVIMDTEEHKFVLNENNQVVQKEVINTTREESGSLEITKIDSTNKTLKGVEFDILDENKNVVDHLVTDENGKATSKKLPLGTYYYKEVKAPENVKMDTAEHAFVLATNNQVVSKTVVNEITTKIRIIKVDESDKPLAGVGFDIFDSNKNKIDHMVTGEDGVAISNKYLEKGTYYVQETEAPEGIVIDKTMYEVVVEEDGQNVVPKIVNNYVKGQLKIYKLIEGTKTPLAGAKFEIADSEGNVVEVIESGEDGVALSSKLKYGTYYFKEIEAPDGFIKDNNIYQFNIENNEEIIETVIYNTEERLPQTGGLLSSDMIIVLIVAVVAVSGYGLMRLLSANKED